MSELKAFNCVDSDVQEFCEPRLVYLKSEADKVIAEKDKEISELKELVEVLKHQACKMMHRDLSEQNERLFEVIKQEHPFKNNKEESK